VKFARSVPVRTALFAERRQPIQITDFDLNQAAHSGHSACDIALNSDGGKTQTAKPPTKEKPTALPCRPNRCPGICPGDGHRQGAERAAKTGLGAGLHLRIPNGTPQSDRGSLADLRLRGPATHRSREATQRQHGGRKLFQINASERLGKPRPTTARPFVTSIEPASGKKLDTVVFAGRRHGGIGQSAVPRQWIGRRSAGQVGAPGWRCH
jgi:hypothetical protein